MMLCLAPFFPGNAQGEGRKRDVGCFGSGLYHGCLNAPKKKLHPDTIFLWGRFVFPLYIFSGFKNFPHKRIAPFYLRYRERDGFKKNTFIFTRYG
jgi:hypothetical protein